MPYVAWPELPAGLSYPVIYAKNAETESSDRIPFLTYTINASQPPYQIQQYAENNIRPELASIEGVNMIEISGASPMEWVLDTTAANWKLSDCPPLTSLRRYPLLHAKNTWAWVRKSRIQAISSRYAWP